MFAHFSKTQKGMALAFTGYTGFALSDTCVKWLTVQGYSISQIITVDTAMGACLLLMLSPKLGGIRSLIDRANAKIHALRIGLNTAVNFLVVFCLSVMPMATLYTGIFTKPFLAALMAMPLYGERIGLNRWLSIAIGFSGVFIAFEPWRDSFEIKNLLLSLLCATVIASMFLVSRSFKGASMLAVGFYPILGSCLVTLPFMIMTYTPIAMADLPFFMLSGLFMSTGIVCVSLAFNTADSAAVSPIIYSEMIWAIIFGLLIFGDVPGPLMLAGAGLIILSGLYLLLSENHKARNS
jgi:drug/metabolite transporter (DMT)-like permease